MLKYNMPVMYIERLLLLDDFLCTPISNPPILPHLMYDFDIISSSKGGMAAVA
jgi:hypothetical protein